MDHTQTSATCAQMSAPRACAGRGPIPHSGTREARDQPLRPHGSHLQSRPACPPALLKLLGLFLTMAPPQMPNLTGSLQSGTCHRAGLILIVFSRGWMSPPCLPQFRSQMPPHLVRETLRGPLASADQRKQQSGSQLQTHVRAHLHTQAQAFPFLPVLPRAQPAPRVLHSRPA